jgi:hypothetical protein
MGISNDFSEYYKTISNAELLNILEKPLGYQLAAIEAAKKNFQKGIFLSKKLKKPGKYYLKNKYKR